MITLTDRLKDVQSFSELSRILELSKLKISRWRGRMVVARGYSGSARIVDLVDAYFRLLKNQKLLEHPVRLEAAQCGDMINTLYTKGEYIRMEAIDLRLKYICYVFSVLRDTSIRDDHILCFWEFCAQEAIQRGNFQQVKARI